MIELIGENIPSVVSGVFSSFSLSDIEKITGEKFDSAFGDAHSTESKRKGKLNQWYQQKFKRNIGMFTANIVMESGQVKENISSFNKDVRSEMSDIVKAVGTDEISVFIPFDISEPENLNNHIQTDTTVRYPVEETPNITFYREAVLEIAALEKELRVEPEDIEYLLNIPLLEKSFKKVLEEMALR